MGFSLQDVRRIPGKLWRVKWLETVIGASGIPAVTVSPRHWVNARRTLCGTMVPKEVIPKRGHGKRPKRILLHRVGPGDPSEDCSACKILVRERFLGASAKRAEWEKGKFVAGHLQVHNQ